jgi:hypothetical protein
MQQFFPSLLRQVSAFHDLSHVSSAVYVPSVPVYHTVPRGMIALESDYPNAELEAGAAEDRKSVV